VQGSGLCSRKLLGDSVVLKAQNVALQGCLTTKIVQLRFLGASEHQMRAVAGVCCLCTLTVPLYDVMSD